MEWMVGAVLGAVYPWAWGPWALLPVCGITGLLGLVLRPKARWGLWMTMGAFLSVATVPRPTAFTKARCYDGPMGVRDAQSVLDSTGGLWRTRTQMPPGSQVEGVWRMEPFRPPTFPRGFSGMRVWAPQGFLGEARALSVHHVDSLAPGTVAILRSKWHLKVAELGWSLRAQQLVHALFLGEARALTPEIKRPLQSLGLAHVLAISGFHIGLIWGFARVLGRWSPYAHRRWLMALVGVVVWAFVGFLGMPTSAVRAAVMATFAACMRGRSGRPGRLAALSSAVWVMLCVYPHWVWDLGFQLSVTAVAALVWVPPSRGGRWVQAAQLTVVAQWAVLPFSVHFFHQFPGAFLLANLLLTPFLLGIYPYTLFMLLAAQWGWVGPFPEWALDGVVAISGFGLWEGLYPSSSVWWSMVLSTAVGIWAWGHRKMGVTVLAGMATIGFMTQSHSVPTHGHLALRRGRGIASVAWHGDSARIRATAGLSRQSFVWEVEASSFLAERGITEVDIVAVPYHQFPEEWRDWADADTGASWWWDPP